MTNAHFSVSLSAHPGNAARAGRAVGSMFFSVFGCVWITGWALQTFPDNWTLAAAIILTGLALLTQSIRVYKNNKPAQPDESAAQKRKNRFFHLINGGQWVAILICANVLINIGKPEWIMACAIFIIGLHFVPMARLFRYAPHYLMGFVMMAWAIAYASIFGPAHAIGCLGTGLILWSGAIYALTGGSRA